MGGDEKKGRKISERVFPGLRLLEDLLICAREKSYCTVGRETEKEKHSTCETEADNVFATVIPHISGRLSLCVCSLARDATHKSSAKTSSSITCLPNSYGQKMKISVPPSVI